VVISDLEVQGTHVDGYNEVCGRIAEERKECCLAHIDIDWEGYFVVPKEE